MILDTNAVSALADRDDAALRKVRETHRLSVTLVTVGEYKYGIRQSRYREDLERWLAAFLERAELLCANIETADYYAGVRMELRAAGTPIPANDCWIAAIARQYNLPILSQDRHFDKVAGIRRIEW